MPSKAATIIKHEGDPFGYARRSPSDMDCKLQIDVLIKFGINPGNIFVDKTMGKATPRKGWKACLAKLKEGDLLVVQSLSRIGLTMGEVLASALLLRGKGCHFVELSRNLDSRTPEGHAHFMAIAHLKEVGTELTGERSSVALSDLRKRGEAGPQQKVTDDQVRWAITQIETGRRIKDVVAEIGISRQAYAKRRENLLELDKAKRAAE